MGGIFAIPYTPDCTKCRSNIGNYGIDKRLQIELLEKYGITPLFGANPYGPYSPVPYYWCKKCNDILMKESEFYNFIRNNDEIKFSEVGFTRYHS
jgi:hypothetical protein